MVTHIEMVSLGMENLRKSKINIPICFRNVKFCWVFRQKIKYKHSLQVKRYISIHFWNVRFYKVYTSYKHRAYTSQKTKRRLPDRKKCVILSIWKTIEPKAALPLLFFGGCYKCPPDERKEGDNNVCYISRFTFVLYVCCCPCKFVLYNLQGKKIAANYSQ